MASLDSIDRLLSLAASLIDRAATEVRDAKLAPVQENIEILGRSLVGVFEVQHRIYALRPDLTPEHLKAQSQFPEADRLLTKSMFRASELERSGNIDGAISEFRQFIALNSSALHTEIALGEIERLEHGTHP